MDFRVGDIVKVKTSKVFLRDYEEVDTVYGRLVQIHGYYDFPNFVLVSPLEDIFANYGAKIEHLRCRDNELISVTDEEKKKILEFVAIRNLALGD